MEVVPLLVFVSLLLVCFALVLFFHSIKQGDHEHADRLSLLPLEDDLAIPVKDEMSQETIADIEETEGQYLNPLKSTSTESEHEHDARPHDETDHL